MGGAEQFKNEPQEMSSFLRSMLFVTSMSFVPFMTFLTAAPPNALIPTCGFSPSRKESQRLIKVVDLLSACIKELSFGR